MRVVWTDADSAPRVRDQDDFTAFCVEVPEGLPLSALSPHVAAVADPVGDREEVGISADLVRTLAGSPAAGDPWTTAFDAMLDAVAELGWYDGSTGTIRAHVVRR